MSIINEALRKTQQIRKQDKEKRSQVKIPVAPLQPSVELHEPQSMELNKPQPANPGLAQSFNVLFGSKMTGYLFVTALLIFVSYFSYQHAKNENHPVEIAVAKPVKHEIAFSGIFASDNSKIAIINKQSYHKGDMVNGMKIVAIDQDSVDLQQNNKLIKIRAGATYLI